MAAAASRVMASESVVRGRGFTCSCVIYRRRVGVDRTCRVIATSRSQLHAHVTSTLYVTYHSCRETDIPPRRWLPPRTFPPTTVEAGLLQRISFYLYRAYSICFCQKERKIERNVRFRIFVSIYRHRTFSWPPHIVVTNVRTGVKYVKVLVFFHGKRYTPCSIWTRAQFTVLPAIECV